jgi:hypothetical protein
MLPPSEALIPYGVKHFFLSFEEEPEKSRFYQFRKILSFGQSGLFNRIQVLGTRVIQRNLFFGKGRIMFLFNSLHQGSRMASRSPASKSRKAFALAIMFCLSTALLFTGCKTDSEPDPGPGTESIEAGFIPAGEWKDDYGSGYNITESSLEYYTADTEWEGTTYPGENIKGGIKEAVDFLQDAGVLLVQITTSSTSGQTEKFIGVYYKDYTKSHVFLANAIDETYSIIVKDTLAEAKNTFTVDNVKTHVTYWGTGYKK